MTADDLKKMEVEGMFAQGYSLLAFDADSGKFEKVTGVLISEDGLRVELQTDSDECDSEQCDCEAPTESKGELQVRESVGGEKPSPSTDGCSLHPRQIPDSPEPPQPSVQGEQDDGSWELDGMVRDFCAVGPRPKSEVKRRIVEYAAKSSPSITSERIAEITKELFPTLPYSQAKCIDGICKALREAGVRVG